MHCINWDDLRYFLAVAQCGQLSRAAHQLRTSHVTVGRHIDRLEWSLKVTLFNRGPKGYALTAEGKQLLQIAESMGEAAAQLREQLTGAQPTLSGTVRLNIPEGLCSFFTRHILPDFRRAFPAVVLEVVSLQQITSLPLSVSDITISLDPPRGHPWHSEPIMDYSLHVCATQDYLDRSQAIRDRDDLLGHTFIGYIDEMIFMAGLDYLAEVNPKLQTALQCTSIFSQLNAVENGLGLAVVPDFLRRDRPHLIPVLPDEIEIRRSYWLACRQDLRNAPRESVIIDHLLEELRHYRNIFAPSKT